MKPKFETGIKSDGEGHCAWFKIGVQTFTLRTVYCEGPITSKKHAEWYESMLKTALGNLQNDDSIQT